MKPWYLATESEALAFFDVDMDKGLSRKSVKARLVKFGPNSNNYLPTEIQKVYKTWLKREGRSRKVELEKIVPGDIVLLSSGDRVPADIRLLKVENLQIDQLAITGNNLPVCKNTFALQEEAEIDKQKCMAFAGSFVTHGNGIGVVVAHGNKVAICDIVPKKQKKVRWLDSLTYKKLHRNGVVIQNFSAVKKLHLIDMVFVDTDAPENIISEIIRKIQLPYGIPCKFLVDKKVIKKLKKEYQGSIIYDGSQISKHVPKQFLGMISDCQFITDANATDMLKITSRLRQNGASILWITDGKEPSLAMQAAAVSLVVGDCSRDDVLAHADLIAINSNEKILMRILYNRK